MDLSFETIDAFRELAGKISTDIFAKIPARPDEHYRHKGHNRVTHHDNNFADNPLNGRMPTYEMADNGNVLRIYCGSEWARFHLRDIRLREVKAIEYDDPSIVDKNVNPVTVKSWTNNSDTEETHKLTSKKSFSRMETKASASAFALQITNSLQTKVGGGIPGVGDAEVKTGLEIKTNFEHRFEKSKSEESSTEETEEQSYTVPPRTKTALIRQEGTSDYHQTVRMTGVLDATVRIESQGDWVFTVQSFLDLENMIRGGNPDKVDRHAIGNVAKYFSERHFQDYRIDFSPIEMTVENVLHYRNVQSSSIERTDTPVSKGSK